MKQVDIRFRRNFTCCSSRPTDSGRAPNEHSKTEATFSNECFPYLACDRFDQYNTITYGSKLTLKHWKKLRIDVKTALAFLQHDRRSQFQLCVPEEPKVAPLEGVDISVP
jgi:hypothetical protein